MAKMDTDKDGRLSRAEFDAAHKGSEEKFGAHDLDGDGFITQAEMDKHHADMKAQGDGKAKAEGKCGEGKCGEGKCGGKP
jgi:Ca2+-binding EF-hand superfamily protein